MKAWNLDQRQKAALEYFSQNAGNWQTRAAASSSLRVNTIKQRNDIALSLVESKGGIRTALDLGCGTGDLAIELALKGVCSCGIDFSPQMIQLAGEAAADRKVNELCRFKVGSAMNPEMDGERFDLVTAFGLIEYLNPEQLPDFFATCRNLVTPRRYLQIGSRNRLFNAFSLNQFTEAELKAGTLVTLVTEAIRIASAKNLEAFIADSGTDDDLRVLKTYPQTDVAVAGFQYTPLQIIRLLQEAGFNCVGISPIHYHGIPPAVAKTDPETYVSIAQQIQQRFADDFRMVPLASTFIVTAI